jgi:hypothetical protein
MLATATRTICSSGALGHPRVMLQRHVQHVAPFVQIARQPDEGGDRSDARIGAPQARQFSADLEVLLLHSNRHRQGPSSWASRP